MNRSSWITLFGAITAVMSLASLTSANPQSFSTGLGVAPTVLFPVGEKAPFYTVGLGATAEGLLSYALLPGVTLGLNAGYGFIPLNLRQSGFIAPTNLTLANLGGGVRTGLSLGDRVSVSIGGHVSGFAAMLAGTRDMNAFGISYGIAADAAYLLSNSLLLRLGGEYIDFFGLYTGLRVSLGIISRTSGPGSNAIPRRDFVPLRPGTLPDRGFLQLRGATTDLIFPVLYKYYDSRPIGRVTVTNTSDLTVEGVEIRLSLAQHMDASKLSARIDTLEPGASRDVDLYALFADSILSITEGAKLAATISADYTVRQSVASDTTTVSVDILDRNSLRWDDDRKVAAFVTARDEEIARFARNVASVVRDARLPGFSTEFQMGVALLASMDMAGVAYVIDPSSSYLELSQDSSAIDSVQFPRQTLLFGAGDCDDLSVAYAALLEAVGIETAFITIPGHIYSAFRLSITPGEAQAAFSRPDDLIIDDMERVWLPVETTILSEGFVRAWQVGAQQWRQNRANAELLPTREAWTVYAPVAFSASRQQVEVPPRTAILHQFNGRLDAFVRQEISDREVSLLARLQRDPSHAPTLNRLGVLHARFGRTEQARDYLLRSIAEVPYTPALINLGNLAMMEDDHGMALSYYKRALEVSPDAPAAALGAAQAHHALGDVVRSRNQFESLERVAPDLAARYSYLGAPQDTGTRASESVLSLERIYWAEDE